MQSTPSMPSNYYTKTQFTRATVSTYHFITRYPSVIMEDHPSSYSASSTALLSVVPLVAEDKLVVEKELCRGARKRHRPSSSSSSSSDNNDDDDNRESIVAVSSLDHDAEIVSNAKTILDDGSVDDHQSDEIIVPRINLCDDNNNYNVIIEAYKKYQAVYLPRYENKKKKNVNGNDGDNNGEEKDNLQWKDLSEIYKNLNSKDKESFCIENNNNNSELFEEEKRNREDMNENNKDDVNIADTSSSSFLTYNSKSDNNNNHNNNIGYCSFLIQNDKIALSDILRRLPVRDPLFNNNNGDDDPKDHYEPCLWVFFGRNINNNNNNNNDDNNNNDENNNDLQGRPEHTDQISHDGTWHYQLSGTKRWLLRPTPTLLRQFKKEQQQQQKGSTEDDQKKDENEQQENEEEEQKQIRIDCQEGDILIVNTRLWKHQTIIPPQIQPSVSYARDFWIRSQSKHDRDNNNNNNNKEGEGTITATTKMTNVDGLYATDDVESDTIIFKENDMPDCELHTSSSKDVANCKVVELEDGTQAVVSSRYINAGEFFCIIESESSDDDDDDDDEDDDDDNDDYDDDTDDDACVPCT